MRYANDNLSETTPARSPRVIIADDDERFRAALAGALRRAGVIVVGSACDGREAVTLAVRLRPDVVLIDLLMPGLDGIMVTRQIRARAPEIRSLIVTLTPDAGLGLLALRAGAWGYLAKEAGIAPMTTAVVRLMEIDDLLVPFPPAEP